MINIVKLTFICILLFFIAIFLAKMQRPHDFELFDLKENGLEAVLKLDSEFDFKTPLICPVGGKVYLSLSLYNSSSKILVSTSESLLREGVFLRSRLFKGEDLFSEGQPWPMIPSILPHSNLHEHHKQWFSINCPLKKGEYTAQIELFSPKYSYHSDVADISPIKLSLSVTELDEPLAGVRVYSKGGRAYGLLLGWLDDRPVVDLLDQVALQWSGLYQYDDMRHFSELYFSHSRSYGIPKQIYLFSRVEEDEALWENQGMNAVWILISMVDAFKRGQLSLNWLSAMTSRFSHKIHLEVLLQDLRKHFNAPQGCFTLDKSLNGPCHLELNRAVGSLLFLLDHVEGVSFMKEKLYSYLPENFEKESDLHWAQTFLRSHLAVSKKGLSNKCLVMKECRLLVYKYSRQLISSSL